jgi:hypothetical protein
VTIATFDNLERAFCFGSLGEGDDVIAVAPYDLSMNSV